LIFWFLWTRSVSLHSFHAIKFSYDIATATIITVVIFLEGGAKSSIGNTPPEDNPHKEQPRDGSVFRFPNDKPPPHKIQRGHRIVGIFLRCDQGPVQRLRHPPRRRSGDRHRYPLIHTLVPFAPGPKRNDGPPRLVCFARSPRFDCVLRL